MFKVYILNKRIVLFFLSLFWVCKTYSYDFNYGLFVNEPFHINLYKSKGLYNDPSFDNNIGLFLFAKPNKGFFGFKFDISRFKQTSRYMILNQSLDKNCFAITSKCSELSLHVFNYYKTKFMIEYGFSFKIKSKITMVEYEKMTKSGIFSTGAIQSNDIQTIPVKNELSKQTTFIIPNIQIGFSYLFKKVSIGSQFSIDVLPLFKQPYFIVEDKYSINPQYFSISIFARLYLKTIFHQIFNSKNV